MSSKNKIVKLRSLDDQRSASLSEQNTQTVHATTKVHSLKFRVLGQYIADYIPVAVDLAIAAARCTKNKRPSSASKHGTVVIGDYHFGWEMAREATVPASDEPCVLLITIPNMQSNIVSCQGVI